MFSWLFDPRSWSTWIGRKLYGVGEDEARAIRRTVRVVATTAGFTLIEMLLVVAILGVLASVVVFATSGQSRAALAAACRSDVRSVSTAQEAYLLQAGFYAGNVSELVQSNVLRAAPSSESYQIATESSGVVTADPGCESFDDSSSVVTPPPSQPGSQLAAACSAGVASVAAAQDSYLTATGGYASSVNVLVKKGYLAADPSDVGFKVKTTKVGTVTSTPTCSNISEVACNAAISEVQDSQSTRFSQLGKYASNVAQLITGGYLSADPSTDAYKIKTTNKGITTSTPGCAALA